MSALNKLAVKENQEQTMTSLELMDIVNNSRIDAGETLHEPRKFLAKVEDEIDDLTGKKFRLNNNQTKTVYYDLTRDQCMLVGMRESKAVRRNVLLKLKEKQRPQIPQTMAEALQLAADQARQLELAAPAVEFVTRYVESEQSLGFRQVAKLLKIKENEFRLFLYDNKIFYKLAGKMTPLAQHLDAGRFTVKAGVNDAGVSFTQTKFTPKGVEWIAGLLASSEIKNKLN